MTALTSNLKGVLYRCQNHPEWTMEYISEGCYDLTGYRPEDFIKNQKVSFGDLILPEYREKLWQQWQKSLSLHIPFQDEYPIKNARGQIRWILAGSGVYDSKGNLMVEGLMTDITVKVRGVSFEGRRRKIRGLKTVFSLPDLDPTSSLR